MARQNISTPLSVLLAGLVFVALLLARPHDPSSAAPPRQDYPPAEQTQTAEAEEEDRNNQDDPYPVEETPTPPSSGARSPTPTRTQTAARTPTSAARATSVPPGARQATATRAPTIDPADDATAFPLDDLSTPTPTNELTCVPGERVDIAGSGPPRSGFLLYFGGRAVSGGTTGPDGRFTISLTVGAEAAGTYQVAVRVRGSSQVLRELTCTVPPTTPTPLPRRP